jgi:hypothetical protein
MNKKIYSLEEENKRLRQALKAARNALDGTAQLLIEHPILRGHAERVRRITAGLYIINNTLRESEDCLKFKLRNGYYDENGGTTPSVESEE